MTVISIMIVNYITYKSLIKKERNSEKYNFTKTFSERKHFTDNL